MATVIGKSAKKQFPVYVGEFWSMSPAFVGDNYLHSMATVIGKSAKKQFAAYVGEFWSMSPEFVGNNLSPNLYTYFIIINTFCFLFTFL